MEFIGAQQVSKQTPWSIVMVKSRRPKRLLDQDRQLVDGQFESLRTDRMGVNTRARVSKQRKSIRPPVSRAELVATSDKLAELLNKV